MSHPPQPIAGRIGRPQGPFVRRGFRSGAAVAWTTATLLSCGIPPAAAAVPFSGKVDFDAKSFELNLQTRETEPLVARVWQEEEGTYRLALNVDRLRSAYFDISTRIEATASIEREGSLKVSGELLSRDTLLNRKPVEDVDGRFTLVDQVMILEELSCGPIIVRGAFRVEPPHEWDLTFTLKDLDMARLVTLLAGKVEIPAEGKVSGDLRVSGKPGESRVHGSLRSYNGRLHTLDFYHMTLNLSGIYPAIQVQGKVAQTNGLAFDMSGMMDLSRQDTLKQQFNALRKDPVVSDNARDIEWTLKRVESAESSQSTELKYFLKKSDAVDASVPEGSDMIGVERRLEF